MRATNAGRSITIAIALAGHLSVNCLAQTSSLAGSVSDALNDHPLGGVSIIVAPQPPAPGVSDPDGHYVIYGLKHGSKITLTFDKGGYARYSVSIPMSETRIIQDVSLFKDTVDAAYWSSWTGKVMATSSNGSQKVRVARAWKEISNGGLSTESKAAAAKRLLSALSYKGDAPEDLLESAGEMKPDLKRYANKEPSDIDNRISKAGRVLEDIMATPDKAIPDNIISDAKCIAVIPSMVKIAVGFGGSHGKGVATCRTADGRWSAPAPITITGGSWGLQLGGQAVDLVMVVMNDEGMQHLLSRKFRIGDDTSAAAGPVGRYAAAETDWKMKAEVLTYFRARGVFGGIDLNGSAITEDKDETRILYGRYIPFEEILSGKVQSPPDSASRNFLAAVKKYSPGGGPRSLLDLQNHPAGNRGHSLERVGAENVLEPR